MVFNFRHRLSGADLLCFLDLVLLLAQHAVADQPSREMGEGHFPRRLANMKTPRTAMKYLSFLFQPNCSSPVGDNRFSTNLGFSSSNHFLHH